ncbi:hypothetical protein JTB14_031740 [Gonioctena quinquepunctata]|nr:hypothetical protein JTB14_031740 [Gonioctena quinquepunctata]
MKLLKNLAEVTKEEQRNFINSFDQVFLDMDGVIWLSYQPFPGALDCIESLKQKGKKVRYVSNNPLLSIVDTWKIMIREGFNVEIEDMMNPILSIIFYLKSIDFNRKIYAIGTQVFKDELRKAGFEVAPDPPQKIEETIPALMKHIEDDKDIGAVLYGLDLNLTTLKLQKAITYLKRKDCILVAAAGDRDATIGPLGPLIGNQHLLQLITDFTGKEPTFVAKPTEFLAKIANKKFGVIDPKRTLFIGDKINQDMGFAHTGGYNKLLILTGITKIEDIHDWRYPEEFKPEYYVESLKVLHDIMKSINKS